MSWFTDEDVEKAAEFAYLAFAERDKPWSQLTEVTRRNWRLSVRAALSAVNPYEWLNGLRALLDEGMIGTHSSRAFASDVNIETSEVGVCFFGKDCRIKSNTLVDELARVQQALRATSPEGDK